MTARMAEIRNFADAKASRKKREEAPRQRRARAIGDMLPEIGRASFRRFGFVQSAVVSRWPEIVGERYARVSAPEAIRFPPGKRSNGVLRLTVSGAHATMMQHIEPEIIERVNRFFGYPAVARIAIQQGQVAVTSEKRPVAAALKPVPQKLGESLSEIGDPELRACLEGLAASVATAENGEDKSPFGPSRSLQIKRLGDIGPAATRE
ncbi:MAG: DciA family protein [Parasphingopyxis sp.]|uniref:DUF721 domain-containing protein n=1 Tax=Parasphingopyxis sp. TaxID=1920299 RepID=UPI002639F23A|nr:DciA family protein [uncultured Parasphingopyxis sp.]